MEHKNKVLMISMLSGFGHIRAGEALLDYAKEHLKTVDAHHVDVCDIDPSFKQYAKQYDLVTKRFPFIWDIAYRYLPARLMKKMISFKGSLKDKVIDYIEKENPDIIIFTNVVIVPIFIATLRKRFPKIILAVLVTDYHAHPYYVFQEINRYFVGHQQVKDDLVKLGVKQQRIIVSGIPINPRFYIKQSVKSLKKKYGTNNDLPVVLLIASFKLPARKILILTKQLLSLRQKINLVFIANGNQGLYELIQRNFSKKRKLQTVLWTNMMEEYIKMSDVVITKAGGLTVSECLAIKKPMIMLKPIPGQEEYNAAFVEKNGFGKRVDTIDQVVKVLPRILLEKNNQRDSVINENPCETIFKGLDI